MKNQNPFAPGKAKAIAIAQSQPQKYGPLLLKFGLTFIMLLLLGASAFAQVTIFEEDFSSSSNGATSGTNWESDASDCYLSNGSDYFEVKSNRFEGRDMDGEGIWYTNVIDIRDYTDVELEVSLEEVGSMEGSDYVKVYYKLDGGAETLFSTNGSKYNDFGSVTASQTGLNGYTLEVLVKVRNDNGSEYHRINSVSISGTEALSTLLLSTTATDVSCNDGSDGSIDLSLTDNSGSGSSGSGLNPNGSSYGDGCSPVVPSSNACASCTSIAPTTGTLNINSGDVVCIPAGQTFTGYVNMSGGTLVICGNIIPWSFNFNSGTIINNSALSLNNLSMNSNCYVENYGTLQVSGTVSVNEAFENHGALMISGSLNVNGSASFLNTNYIAISSSLDINNNFDNLGTINVSNELKVNGGGILNNECTMNIGGEITLNDSLVNNGSVNGSGPTNINGGGVLNLGPNAYFSASSLKLNGEIVGSGPICATVEVSGNTTINGSGEIGTNVDYCDADGIEQNNGTVTGTTDCSCNATGVVPPTTNTHTYIWSNGATTQDISGLSAGTYSVTVTSSSGATATKTTTVSEPDAINASISLTNATAGQSDGSLDLTVSGGTSPYSFTWSNGDNTEDADSLSPGTYTVTVTDDNGCTTTTSEVVSYGNVSGCICVKDGNWSVDAEWLGNCHGGGGQYPNYMDTAIIIGHTVNVENNETAALIEMGSISGKPCSLSVVNSGSIIVGYNIEMTNDQNNAMLLSISNSGSITIGGNIVMDIDNANTTTIKMSDNAVLKLSGDIVRNSRPNRFGSLLMTNNALIELNGTTQQTIAESFGNNDDSFDYLNLKINNTTSSAPHLDLEGDVNVTNSLTLTDGIIATGPYLMKVTSNNSSAIVGGSSNSYIAGQLRRYIASNNSEYMFPIGKDDASSYNWFKLKNGELEDVEYVTASFGDLNSDDLLSSITIGLLQIPLVPMYEEGMWTVEPDRQPTGGYYTAYVSTENFQGLADNSFELVKRSSGGGVLDWALHGGILPLANAAGSKVNDGYTLLEGLTSFSEFGIRETEGATGLPVELTTLSVTAKDQKVYIDWATAVEINNKEFTVERSEDATNFEPVTTVPGAGNSSVLNEYSAIDNDPLLGTSFYRLKQIDYDSKFKYSDILPVTVMSAIKTEFSIYPNPNKGSFKVEVTTPLEEVELQIMNSFGQLVHVEQIVDVTGKAIVDLNMGNLLPAGIYFVKMNVGKDTFIKQMMIE